MLKENTEIVLFETEDRSISLPVEVKDEMVWLSANQMALLFGRDEKEMMISVVMNCMERY